MQEQHPNPKYVNLPDEDPRYKQFQREASQLNVYSFVEPQYRSLEKTPLSVKIEKKNNVLTVDAGKKYRAASMTGTR